MNPPQRPKDDSDEIMAAIMSGRQATPTQPAPSEAGKVKKSAAKQPQTPNLVPDNAASKVKKRPRIRIKKLLFALFVTMALAGAAYLAYRQKDRLKDLIAPPSPFSNEIAGGVNFDLYYPTRLPEGFKLEKNSIGKLEDNVVIYRVSNDVSQVSTFTLQPVSPKVDYDNIFKPEADVQKYDVPDGRALISVGEGGSMVGHLLINDTWVIAETNTAVFSREALLDIFNSMRTG